MYYFIKEALLPIRIKVPSKIINQVSDSEAFHIIKGLVVTPNRLDTKGIRKRHPKYSLSDARSSAKIQRKSFLRHELIHRIQSQKNTISQKVEKAGVFLGAVGLQKHVAAGISTLGSFGAEMVAHRKMWPKAMNSQFRAKVGFGPIKKMKYEVESSISSSVGMFPHWKKGVEDTREVVKDSLVRAYREFKNK